MDFFHPSLKNERTEKFLANFLLVLVCGSIHEIVDIGQSYIANFWLKFDLNYSIY